MAGKSRVQRWLGLRTASAAVDGKTPFDTSLYGIALVPPKTGGGVTAIGKNPRKKGRLSEDMVTLFKCTKDLQIYIKKVILFFMSIDSTKSNVIKLRQVRFTLKQEKLFNDQGVTGKDLLPGAAVKCPLTGGL